MVDVLARELVSRMQIMPKKKERKRISYEKKQASLGKINQAKFNEESDGSRKKTTNNTDLISYKAVIICYLH
jgi:hydroxyacyl-ACP dehydratase HTD2-like protein with hotdog domain